MNARSLNALGLFHIGLAVGLLHLPISLEIGVTLTFQSALIQSLVLLLYPVTFAFMGVGSAIEVKWGQRGGRAGKETRGPRGLGAPLRLAGLGLAVFLVVSLRGNFLVTETGGLVRSAVAHLVTLGAWFTLLGVGLARGLNAAHEIGRSWVAVAWAIHLVGLAAGYIASPWLAGAVGVNALIAIAGLTFIAAPEIGAIPLVIGVGLAAFLPLDRALEGARDLQKWEDVVSESERWRIAAMSGGVDPSASEPLYLGWSHVQQIRAHESPTKDDLLAVFFNLKLQFTTSAGAEDNPTIRAREAIFQAFRPDDRVLFIAAGGGRSLKVLPFPPHPGVIASDRDPVVMDFFSTIRPDLNGGVYQQASILAGDGRYSAEIQQEPLDAIVLESSRFQPAYTLLPASQPLYLLTREAVATYLDRLSDDGALILEFTRSAHAKHFTIPRQVIGHMDALGATYVTLVAGELKNLYVIASPSRAGLDGFLARMGQVPDSYLGWEHAQSPMGDYRLTDDTPFAAWAMLDADHQRLLYRVVGLLTLLALAGGATLSARGRKLGGWDAAPYFFAIGIAHSAIQISTYYAFRAYFVDEILTILRVGVYLLIYGAIGSALSPRLPRAWLASWGRLGGVAALLALHLLALRVLPFGADGALRELAAAAALLPGGLLMGAFFPLGLAASEPRRLGGNLLADALGTLAGYLLLYVVMIPLGATVYAGLGVAGYLAAAALYRPAERAGG